MVLCTIIELYNEEDSINHHGFSRKVFSGKSRQMVDITINERISSAAKIIGMYLIWKVKLSKSTNRILIYNILYSSETKVVPASAVVFIVIYWGVAISSYMDHMNLVSIVRD